MQLLVKKKKKIRTSTLKTEVWDQEHKSQLGVILTQLVMQQTLVSKLIIIILFVNSTSIRIITKYLFIEYYSLSTAAKKWSLNNIK